MAVAEHSGHGPEIDGGEKMVVEQEIAVAKQRLADETARYRDENCRTTALAAAQSINSGRGPSALLEDAQAIYDWLCGQ